MDRYGNLQRVHSVDFPMSGEETIGRLWRSRSFGSESEWTENRDAHYERHPYRRYSTDSIHRYSLQDPVRKPKYVSYVSVEDDNFAITRMRVPGRRMDRNYSDVSGQQNPAFVSDGIGFQNLAFTVDSDIHVGRIHHSNNLTHPYLPDSAPMHLDAGNTRSYVHDNYSHESGPSATSIHPGEETNGHVNVVYVGDDGDRISQKSGRSSPRKIGNNRVSPDQIERYDKEDGKKSGHSSPRKKNRVSPDKMEMSALSYIGSSDADEMRESTGFSDVSLRSTERESSVHESKLDITVSSKTTYLVDDPRYLLRSAAVAEKQEQPENVGPSRAQDQQLQTPSENTESGLRKGLKCPKALPANWGRRKRVCVSVVGAICLVGLIVFVSLFPASFIYVEYDQIALRRTKSTWKVHDKTYYPGCYVHGWFITNNYNSGADCTNIIDYVMIPNCDGCYLLSVYENAWCYSGINKRNIYHSQRKLRKIMFSESVCHSVYGGRYLWSHVLSRGWVSLVPGPFWEVSTQGGEYSRSEYQGGGGTHPLPLTSSGGHQDMYGWQSGGTHPAGMLSCLKCVEKTPGFGSNVKNQDVIFSGPDMEFYTYNSTAQKEHFNEIDVFTADKNTLQFSATVYWFIRTEELSDLYNKFGRNFSHVFPNIFLSSMRNVAPQFTSRDYMSKRNLIESTIHQALYDKVSGTCCPTCCNWKSGCSTQFLNTQCSRCSKESSCDRGHHIEIRYFYIGEIEIPWEIEGRYLKSLIVEVENEKAQFEQEEAVTRVKSDYLVKNILNQAEEIKTKSEAEAKKIKEIAGVDGDVIEQKATVSGLNGMCSMFSITEEDHKLSLFFFNSIKNMSNLYRFVYDNYN